MKIALIHNKSYRFALLLLGFLCFGQSQAQFYFGSSQEFGKNRIQFRDFNWLYYPDEVIDVYHYQGGQDMAQYALQSAKKHLPELESFFDFPLDERLQIVLYNKQSEFRQSNIGMTDMEDNLGGTTNIVGSKLFLFYEGSHEQLDQQIQHGIAEVLFSQMIYGGSWRDILRSNTLVSIPDWFKDGVIRYAYEPFSLEDEAYIKDGILSGKYDNFNFLPANEDMYAGKSLWMYLSQIYGENVIPNILYMTRMTRSIDSGFLVVLGTTLEAVMEEYKNYWLSRFQEQTEAQALPTANLRLPEGKSVPTEGKALKKFEKKKRKWMGELPVKYKSKYRYSQFAESPDGEHVAFATHQMGQYKIWLYNYATGKKKRIFKREPKLDRLEDKSYPILAWHPLGGVLAFVYEEDSRASLGLYNLEEEENDLRELFRLDKVLDLSFSPDGRQIAFSAVSEGQTDLYLYQMLGNNQSRLTNDVYDDMQPQFLDKERIIFSSNRPDDTLRTGMPHRLFPLNKDIYIFEIDKKKLERITNTPDKDEIMPSSYDGESYTYLSELGGTYNRIKAELDSVISSIDTTIHYRVFTREIPLSYYNRSPLNYNSNGPREKYDLTFLSGGKPYFVSKKIDADAPVLAPGGSMLKPSAEKNKEISQGNKKYVDKKEEDKEVDITNYKFQGEEVEEITFEKEAVVIGTIPEEQDTTSQKKAEFILPKVRNYRLNFATDYVLSQVDNSFNTAFYQTRSNLTSITPGLSGMFKIGLSDLFEDKKLVAGVRFAANFQNNTYAVAYSDLTKRIDKKISFQRQSQRQLSETIGGGTLTKNINYLAEYQWSYPFNELHSLRLSGLYRLDNGVVLSTESSTAAEPNIVDHNLGLKLQYIYDNTRRRGLNLLSGTRYKVFGEYYQSPLTEESDMQVVGFDIRHYQPIHKDLTLVLRMAGSSSFGSRRVLFYMGGVDNWIFERRDDDLLEDPDLNFAYQALVTPLRGFFINVRNGNSFALGNAELRWPIVTYFSKTPVKSDFLQNLQLIAFGDVGSAWTGPSPFSNDNFFNTTTVTNGSTLVVSVDNNRSPLAVGYGAGVRSRVFGYFVRLDLGWGINNGVVLPRVIQLSLNLDI